MKNTRKYIAALAVLAAGSVFYGSVPAQAKGIELDEVKIVISRHHDERVPPPPPEMHRPRGHIPPPPEMQGARGHMPPPEHRRGFAPVHHGHMPPQPPHHRPRGHMPPPPPHRW